MNSSAQLETYSFRENAAHGIDRAMILDRVGGDQELLREITAIFLEEYPCLLDQMRAAISAGDSKQLERAAHSLKGAVANFGAQGATQAAYQLETLGRRGDLHDAAIVLEDLLSEFAQLRPALEDLAL